MKAHYNEVNDAVDQNAKQLNQTSDALGIAMGAFNENTVSEIEKVLYHAYNRRRKWKYKCTRIWFCSRVEWWW